ncbi:glycosyltransferase [Sphingomicrobium sp. XHP0239]|uniref:glycosyltransferase n=1 Tax=Sphingomicrobium maritimum TaxID=3133972 RepID=UPI0031CC80BD
MKPIGMFVHHQGRGHANRAAAIANQLIGERPVTLMSADIDQFPDLDGRVERMALPSLFEEPEGAPAAMADAPTPDTLHCAPLGWSTIRHAVARITDWFDREEPALFVTDVSAELGQLARIASVPHVAVLQHGDRSDPGHEASYAAAAGLLAPYHEALDQPDRRHLADRTRFFPGVGVTRPDRTREEARRAIGVPEGRRLAVVFGGGGGEGFCTTPVTIAARAFPDIDWVTLGKVRHEWHSTPPGNLSHRGWVDNVSDWLAAADLVVSSAGNSTVHQILALGRPWVVVPEWRYFDEQSEKVAALGRARVAAARTDWPSHVAAWRTTVDEAMAIDPEAQRALYDPSAAIKAARWLDRLGHDLWGGVESKERRIPA